MTTTHPTPAPRRSLLAKLHLATWRGRLAWLGAMFVMALIACWLLARIDPFWYRPLDPDDPNVDAASTRAQTLLIELGSTHDRPQTWTITEDEINSFLAVTTAPPFDGHGRRAPVDPAHNPLSDPYIIFSPGQVTICARVTRLPSRDPQGGVGSLTFGVGTVDGSDGKAMGLVKLTGVWTGYLPVPKSIVETRLRAMIPTIYAVVQQAAQTRMGVRNVTAAEPFLEEFAHSLGEGRPFPLQYIKDGREWSIQNLHVDKGSFSITIVPGKLIATTTHSH